MDVVLSIININRILQNCFNDDVILMFLNGYCLDYYDILKTLYPDAKMVIEKNNYHCAALINNEVYDVSGIRCKDDFFIASKNDEDFVYSFYGKMDDRDKKKIINLIKGISKKLII